MAAPSDLNQCNNATTLYIFKTRFFYLDSRYRQREPYSNDYYRSPVFGAYISTDCEGPICVGDPVYAIPMQPKMDKEMAVDKVDMNGILSRG